MKTICKFMYALISVFCISAYASAEVLKPVHILINNRDLAVSEHDNISNVKFYFDSPVSIDQGAVGYVYDNDEIVAKGSFSIEQLSDGKIAYLNIENAPLLLPLGKTYRIVIPEGVFSNTNDEHSELMELVCNIPDKLYYFETAIDYQLPDGTYAQHPLMTESTFTFFYGVELASVDNAKMILCRNDIPIMEFPVGGGWDFGFGFTTTRFGRLLNFENGIKYTFVLPEGSVCSKLRADMVNAEAKKDCYGGYEKVFAPIVYESCDVQNMLGIRQLSLVNVKYTTPIALAPQARLQLLDAEGNVLKEANATLTELGDTYMLTADFGGETLEPSAGYMLCIPEATVVGTGQDITVNSRNLIPLNGYEMSVGDVETKAPRLSLIGDDLRIDNVSRGDRIVAYGPCGTLLMRTIATEGGVIAQLPHGTSLCIVNINGKAYKVMRKK